jgi:uncharacterized membrane protein YsdA (DUF1294 family)
MIFVLAWYVLMSALAFVMYWMDKRRAAHNEWRISERALHTIELLGGWPGAWIAQRMFRHKWRKTRFVVVFWLIVALHALGWTLWFAGVKTR